MRNILTYSAYFFLQGASQFANVYPRCYLGLWAFASSVRTQMRMAVGLLPFQSLPFSIYPLQGVAPDYALFGFQPMWRKQ